MLLKTIQNEENSFQVPMSFQTEERSKTGWKRKKSHLRGCLRRPCTRKRVKIAFCLFYKMDRWIKSNFLLLIP